MENKKETKMDIKKMSLIAGIVAAVLVIVLVVSILMSKGAGLNNTENGLDEDELVSQVTDSTSMVEEIEGTEENVASEEVDVIIDTTETPVKDVVDEVVDNTTSQTNGNSGSGNATQNNNQNSGNQTNTQNKNPGTTYDPMDANKDGYVSGDEEMGYITPAKQACIDAGYGVVVEMDGGEWYAVLMKTSDHKINGKEGWEILGDYLEERGLEGTIGGCWINSEKEWYWYTAQDIREIDENGGWEIIEE